MIVVDASGLYEALDASQPRYSETRRILDVELDPPVLSPFVLAELDYLLLDRRGIRVELAVLEDVAAGAYELPHFDSGDVAAAATIIRRFRDLELGLADASIVVLAARYRTDRVLTLDERHFRALRTLDGRPFVVLPADA